MALSIGVTVGSRIQVGNDYVEVREVLTTELVSVTVNGDDPILIGNAEQTEIAPGVFLFCGVDLKVNGKNLPDSHHSRLAFDAPLSVKINRVEDELST